MHERKIANEGDSDTEIKRVSEERNVHTDYRSLMKGERDNKREVSKKTERGIETKG